jgi:hypothetical protein
LAIAIARFKSSRELQPFNRTFNANGLETVNLEASSSLLNYPPLLSLSRIVNRVLSIRRTAVRTQHRIAIFACVT